MTRPRKVILLVADDEGLLSQRRFFLETRGYRCLAATPGAGAMFLFEAGGIDLVIFLQLQDDALATADVRAMKDKQPDIPALVLSRSYYHDPANVANCFVSKAQDSPMVILNVIQTLIARKRGPKKRPVVNVQPAAEMAPGRESN